MADNILETVLRSIRQREQPKIRSRLTLNFRPYLQHDFDSVYVGRGELSPIGYSQNYDPKLIKSIKTASIAHFMGDSYATTARTIAHVVPRPEDSNDRDDIAISNKLTNVVRYLSELQTTGINQRYFDTFADHTGAQLSDLYGLQIPHTLRAGLTLANRGLIYETSCVLRFCIELLSWVVKVRPLTDVDTIRKVQAQSCIASAKELYPTIGRFYGNLSEQSHFAFNAHSLQEVRENQDSQTALIIANGRTKVFALCLATVAIDICLVVLEKSYAGFLTAPQGVRPNGSLIARRFTKVAATTLRRYANFSHKYDAAGMLRLLA